MFSCHYDCKYVVLCCHVMLLFLIYGFDVMLWRYEILSFDVKLCLRILNIVSMSCYFLEYEI